ncbi:MAG TPA: hypothetical protein PK267_07025, partial [Atribacterota bacterium]|nr:hypothetical protein [Atribacterota bacterium]
MNKKLMNYLLLVLLVCLISPGYPILAATNLNTIVAEMEKSYQKQLAGIQDLTIIQETKGGLSFTRTTYHKKARINNQDVLMTRVEASVMGIDTVVIYDGIYTWSVDSFSGEIEKEEGDLYSFQTHSIFKPEKGILLGEEQVNGKDTYKIQLDNVVGILGMEEMTGPEYSEGEETESYGIFWIDKKDLVPLKAQNFIKSVTMEDDPPVTTNVTTEIDFLDYRLVGSMLIAHQMEITSQIEVDDPSLSSEEKEQQQAFISAMGGMGNMEIVVTYTEYNTGLPADLFDGTLLEPGEPLFGGINDFTEGSYDEEDAEQPWGTSNLDELMESFIKGLDDAMEGLERLDEVLKNIKTEG